MKILLYAVTGLLVFCQSAMADDTGIVEDILRRRLDTVFTVLEDINLDQQTKNQRIVDIVAPMFDFALMAKLSLGRNHWPALSREEKERFTELFMKRLKSSYLKNFSLYKDEKVVYEPPHQAKERIHIPTYLISKDKKISILYKFFKAGDDWKIYDLEIQGVSIIRSYRSQFSRFLENGTVDDLLLKLETPAGD